MKNIKQRVAAKKAADAKAHAKCMEGWNKAQTLEEFVAVTLSSFRFTPNNIGNKKLCADTQ